MKNKEEISALKEEIGKNKEEITVLKEENEKQIKKEMEYKKNIEIEKLQNKIKMRCEISDQFENHRGFQTEIVLL